MEFSAARRLRSEPGRFGTWRGGGAGQEAEEDRGLQHVGGIWGGCVAGGVLYRRRFGGRVVSSFRFDWCRPVLEGESGGGSAVIFCCFARNEEQKGLKEALGCAEAECMRMVGEIEGVLLLLLKMEDNSPLFLSDNLFTSYPLIRPFEV